MACLVLFKDLRGDLSDMNAMILWAESVGVKFTVAPGDDPYKETWKGLVFELDADQRLVFKLMFGV